MDELKFHTERNSLIEKEYTKLTGITINDKTIAEREIQFIEENGFRYIKDNKGFETGKYGEIK